MYPEIPEPLGKIPNLDSGLVDSLKELSGYNIYHESALRDGIRLLATSIRHYVDARVRGTDIMVMGDISPYCWFFGALWQWKRILPDELQRCVCDSIRNSFTHILERRRAVCRVEFAFLAGWLGDLRWAFSLRGQLVGARYGLSELFQLLEYDDARIIPTFFGIGERRHAIWTWDQDPPDGASVAQLCMPMWTYEQFVDPHQATLLQQLEELVLLDG